MLNDPISLSDAGPNIFVRATDAERKIRFPNTLSEFVYTRTYSRWISEERRRETWPETVARYFNFLSTERSIPDDILMRCYNAVMSMGVMPSMRALWCAGPAVKRDNTCMYNCSFVGIDSLKSFSEVLFILMQGTGVGFSVESQFVERLDAVSAPTGKTVMYSISDSTEGWADAFYFGLQNWWKGNKVLFDYSQIRPKGAILNTKGGRASGPEPLMKLMDFGEKTIFGAAGRKLRPIECHDLVCQIAEIVIVGGHRRSSLISFSDISDQEMRHAKDFSRGEIPVIRYQANNSAFYQGRPEQGLFFEEWSALANSGSGERGFSIDNWWRYSENRPQGMLRSNPCHEIGLKFAYSGNPITGENGAGQFCVSGDTPLITRQGLVSIKEAVGKPVEVWNGKKWSEVRPFQTGIGQELYRVQFSDGSYLDVTEYHRFSVSNRNTRRTKTPWREMTTKDLLESGLHKRWATEPFEINHQDGEMVDNGHAYTLGAAVGDGWIRKTSGGGNPNPRVYTGLWGVKDADMPVAGHRGSPQVVGNTAMAVDFCPDQDPSFVTELKTEALAIERLFCWRRESILQFLAGWLDADGTQMDEGGVRLYISQEDRARKVQLLLTRCGIRSTIRLLAEEGSKTNLGVRKQALWYVDITDCSDIPCHRLNTSRGHKPRFKSKYQTIRSIEKLPGRHHTFCFEESDRHMGVFGNTLTYQCNLTAAVMRAHDTHESMIEKVRLATWLGVIQASFTYFPYLREGWKKHCDEDRLLGVDITGQCDNPALSTNKAFMRKLNEVAIETAREASAFFGINMPAAITCGKPSGNSSQMLNCASGFHPRYAPYYYRHVRISSSDPLYRLAREQGVPLFKENGQEELHDDDVTTWVARFPVRSPNGAMTRNDESALDQCKRYLDIMQSWCSDRGHNQSATIYVRDEEWEQIGNWLWDHFDEVSGLSFLPYDGGQYRLAPYEEIDAEEYQKAVKAFPEIDFSKLGRYEEEDRTQGAREFACTSGACELI